MQYLVSVLYMSLFEPEEYNRMTKPVTMNKKTGKVISTAVEDIRTVMVDKDKLSQIVRNGFSFRFINENDATTLYKELLSLTGEKEISEELIKALNVKRETNHDKYYDLKVWLEDKYRNVLKRDFNSSVSGRRKDAIVRTTRRNAFTSTGKDIEVDESYITNF